MAATNNSDRFVELLSQVPTENALRRLRDLGDVQVAGDSEKWHVSFSGTNSSGVYVELSTANDHLNQAVVMIYDFVTRVFP